MGLGMSERKTYSVSGGDAAAILQAPKTAGAIHALKHFEDMRSRNFPNVWVTDNSGALVSEDELRRLAGRNA
ncbi:hypothetical protein BH10PSE7_BH10PSE7_43090 [soil metagenome]